MSHTDSSDEGSEIDVGSRSDSRSLSPVSENNKQHNNFSSKWHMESLVEELNRFRESETFCDVILIVDDRRFPAHRHILSAASDYFKTMFNGNFREKDQKEVYINGISKDIFDTVIRFMYTGLVDMTEESFEDIFRAASMFLLEELTKICEEYGELHMNNSNCVARYKIAEELNNGLLEDVAYGYVRNHFSELVESDELFLAPLSLVTDALRCDMLDVKCEEQASKFVLQYLEINWDDLQNEDILPLFSSLCLETLDPAYIKTNLIDNEYVKTSPSLLRYLTGVHDHLAYNTPLPDSFMYQEIRRLAVPTRGIYLFGGKPSILEDNNCQFISYFAYRSEGEPIDSRISLDVKVTTSNVTNIPTGKCEFAASCSIRGDIYISGLGPKLEEMWKFVSALNQWLQCSKMLSARCRHVMVNSSPNLLYVLGGAVGYDLANKDGEGGDAFNAGIDEYNTVTGRWSPKGYISKSILHPSAVYYNGFIYIIGGAHKRGRDFTRAIQKYDPRTETTVILSVSLPISVHCPKAITIARTVVVVGFHNSVAISMDALTAVHTVNVSESQCSSSNKDVDNNSVEMLDTGAECMTVRRGSKVAWFGLELFGRDIFVIGGQNTDNVAEDTVKRMDIDCFLSSETRVADMDWHIVGKLQQKQRFCTVTGQGFLP